MTAIMRMCWADTVPVASMLAFFASVSTVPVLASMALLLSEHNITTQPIDNATHRRAQATCSSSPCSMSQYYSIQCHCQFLGGGSYCSQHCSGCCSCSRDPKSSCCCAWSLTYTGFDTCCKNCPTGTFAPKGASDVRACTAPPTKKPTMHPTTLPTNSPSHKPGWCPPLMARIQMRVQDRLLLGAYAVC